MLTTSNRAIVVLSSRCRTGRSNTDTANGAAIPIATHATAVALRLIA